MFISPIADNSAKNALAVFENPAQENVYKPWCSRDPERILTSLWITVGISGAEWG